MTTTDYLEQLQVDLAKLKQDASDAGIEVSANDTFTTLATKFEGVGGGGADLSDYYTETIRYGTSSASGYTTTLKKLPAFKIDPNNTGSTAYMFANFPGTAIDCSELDTSNVTNMDSMFRNCHYITELDLSGFYTTRVTNMKNMFNDCWALSKIDMRNFTFDSSPSTMGMFSNFNNYNCLIIVKSQTEKTWVQNVNTSLTNVKTVDEYEAMQ